MCIVWSTAALVEAVSVMVGVRMVAMVTEVMELVVMVMLPLVLVSAVV